MRESKTREIDGRLYEAVPLLPMVGLKVLTRISKLIGEPLGIAGSILLGADGDVAEAPGPEDDVEAGVSALDRDLDDDVLGKVIGKVIVAFTNRLDEVEVVDTVKTLLSTVQVQGESDNGTRRIVIDVDFGGAKLLSLLKVVSFAIEVNFSDFLGASGASGLIARAQSAAVSRFKPGR